VEIAKLLKCDGKLLEVRGIVILEDDAARDLVRDLVAAQKVGSVG
jgi:hypothetical protein